MKKRSKPQGSIKGTPGCNRRNTSPAAVMRRDWMTAVSLMLMLQPAAAALSPDTWILIAIAIKFHQCSSSFLPI